VRSQIIHLDVTSAQVGCTHRREPTSAKAVNLKGASLVENYAQV